MGSRARIFFDLNELPAEEEDETNIDMHSQPQEEELPSSSPSVPNVVALPAEGSQGVPNNRAFIHAAIGSGFQPFVRVKDVNETKDYSVQRRGGLDSVQCSSSLSVAPQDSKGPFVRLKDEYETKDCSVQRRDVLSVAPENSKVPFVRVKDVNETKDCGVQRRDSQDSIQCSPSLSVTPENSKRPVEPPAAAFTNNNASLEDEREEGEWCDMEGDRADSKSKLEDLLHEGGSSHKQGLSEHRPPANDKDPSGSNLPDQGIVSNDVEMKDEQKELSNSTLPGQESSRSSDCSSKGDTNAGVMEEPSVAKPRDVKGIEAMHALKFANNPAKRPKLDENKEAMLGKKRNRQTVFLSANEVKYAAPMKSSTPKRQAFPSVLSNRNLKESSRTPTTSERPGQVYAIKDQKQAETSGVDNAPCEMSDNKVESNGSANSLVLDRSKKLATNRDSSPEVHPLSVSRQGSLKQPADSVLQKNLPIMPRKPSPMASSTADQKLGNKKHPPKKQNINYNFSYQDTSVERLIREVTNEKFWLHPEESDLQCVPGQFDSVEEYVRVFEPLLLEECRAQLYSTWEESTEHVMVRVKHVEKRERGWYDVVLLPSHDLKWSFKEGDAAVLSTPRPGAVRSKRNSVLGSSDEGMEPELSGRVAGTVRRYSPIDTRDLHGAILHFYIGDAYDSKPDEEHILRKLLPRSIWYLTLLGSLATTQREYIGLHAFRRLNLQMQSAILKPSPEQFPKYEEKPPAMPECFTQNFVDHLFRNFNGPQLAAIQWAAMHTAAGTSGATKKQDPWPFTLVQGPPGTGKTHTVWGMLNVIHLVQYQHYYAALLKKLAPESYRQPNESSYESTGTGSIDEVLQNMDQNLFRTLPKLCPKPRMLVCAPSNAATDELLSRVLNRGFIDGEMKIYRPDVARVGVDSQNRAAQAVSVEQRSNLLLEKGRDEVIGWLQNLKMHEAQCAQKISQLQRQLNAAAAVGRSQGSVGVDPDVLVARDHNRDVLLQNLAQIVEQRDKILVEMSRLLIVEGKFRSSGNFNIEEARASLEASFANEAEIVFTTLSSSGRKLFSRLTHGFDMIVIDEAAQASEVGILPPLSLGAARCVLVGDPQQLPATVISKAAGTLLYSRSLFERFQQAGCPTMLLSIQYRMHPQIRDFPSQYFYQGRLMDSESVSNSPDEVYYKDPLLQPYMFFDILHGRESHKGGSVSYQNIHEAQFCLKLYEHLQNIVKTNGGSKVSVGIITPYKLQLRCVEREFEQVLKSEEGKDLYINTVDAFQGQERDVIIMSCVRASGHGVGFVADIRRMNVALTRAKRALWVVGNANALMQSEDWAALISDAKSRKCFMDLNSIPKEFLVLKGSNHDSPTKLSQNMRGPRTIGQRPRNLDGLHKSGSQFDEDKSKSASLVPRNGSYRSLKLQNDNSLEDLGQPGERPREAWQHGSAKRSNSSGVCRRES